MSLSESLSEMLNNIVKEQEPLDKRPWWWVSLRIVGQRGNKGCFLIQADDGKMAIILRLVELKLFPTPEMQRHKTGGKMEGELLVKGPVEEEVFPGMQYANRHLDPEEAKLACMEIDARVERANKRKGGE